MGPEICSPFAEASYATGALLQLHLALWKSLSWDCKSQFGAR
jgi:hypothetical protein